MTRSPISSPQTKDPNPPPTSAVARANDEVTWALVRLLVEKGVISAGDLSSKLHTTLDEFRRAGPMRSDADVDRVATSLAIERLITALEGMR